MTALRVGIVCDYLEERWPSMDLIGDMLMQTLPAVSRGRVEASDKALCERLCGELADVVRTELGA